MSLLPRYSTRGRAWEHPTRPRALGELVRDGSDDETLLMRAEPRGGAVRMPVCRPALPVPDRPKEEPMHACARSRLLLTAVTIFLVAAVPAAAWPPTGGYEQHDLVSNQPGVGEHTDANLVNAWGLSAGPTTPWWVSDNGADVSTL